MPPNIPYTKPPLSIQDQITLLQGRGLIINNIPKAEHLLSNLSYYRLSGYWYPLLQDKVTHNFKPGATFEKAFNLYCFDRELRLMILSELEKIEVALRAKLVFILSHEHNPFWFREPHLFQSPDKHRKSIVKISNEYQRSDIVFIKAFKNKYSDVYPPSWITMEILSMGTLSMIYSNLKPIRGKNDVANYFGLDKKVFSSWLHSLVYVRNICAHHSRLWNRVLGIQPRTIRNPRNQWIVNSGVSNKKTYYILCILLYLLQTVNPNNTFPSKFRALHAKYSNVDLNAMGFHTDWSNEPLWQ